MTERQMIYVAGPYTAPTDEATFDHVMEATRHAVALILRGHWPVVPHFSWLVDVFLEDHGLSPFSYDFYMDWDDQLLQRCDAILHYASSKGADLELSRAKERGMTIYTSIEEVPWLSG
jgi:hypothetical protein